MEWDTAAGHCIAECAGASMTTLDYSIFEYNKESLLNGGFVCKAC
jgi:3'(2'), 5'-bisphosphate nucleotidase